MTTDGAASSPRDAEFPPHERPIRAQTRAYATTAYSLDCRKGRLKFLYFLPRDADFPQKADDLVDERRRVLQSSSVQSEFYGLWGWLFDLAVVSLPLSRAVAIGST